MKKKCRGQRESFFSPNFSLPDYFVNQISYLRLETLPLPLVTLQPPSFCPYEDSGWSATLMLNFLPSDGRTKARINL